ncbi:MAG: oligopeptide transporter, OPT family [Pirellulaceae bacterium]|nr:oligopeptide transporter, OPT family [Pirellulaceae bacterium]
MNGEDDLTELESAPEITMRVVVLGLLLAVVMGAANVYVGLKAGMTVSASIPAAVMAMLLFRLFFRHSSILEANQVQTCASAGESLAAGIIFTMPALILIGYWKEFDYWVVSFVALSGGLLGILFMIPMRRVFVVDNDELPYPEGVACAAVLEAGDVEHTIDEHHHQDHVAGHDPDHEEHRNAVTQQGGSEATSLVVGGLIGAVFKVVGGFFGLLNDTLETAREVGGRIFYFGGDLSPMLVAVGFIVRLNVAVLIFIGGTLGWLIGIPLYGGGGASGDPVSDAYGIWSSQIRYVGVGAMIMGGISSLFSVRHGLLSAVTELRNSMRKSRDLPSTNEPDLGRDIPTPLIIVIGIVCISILAIINYQFTGDLGIAALSTVVMVVMGFFFTAVASYIVGLVGNSNSPVSGMTITAVLVSGGMLWLFNYSGVDAMVATLGVAAIVCCVACTAGDVCNDLKTGSLVGAAPFRQQMMQIGGVVVAAFVMAPVLTLLHENTPGGIGGEKLSAPQASLFANLAKGFSGEGTLPWDMIGIGAGLGVAILVIDLLLQSSGSKHRAHLMPIAVGMYLPFGLATPILIGGLIAYFYSRGVPEINHDRLLHRGVLFSSGIIAGEALTAVFIAALAAAGILGLDFGLSPTTMTALSMVVAIAMVASFFVFAKPDRDR